MANFRGQWKKEWNARIAYFEKEIGKVEQKNKKQKWSLMFWKKAKPKQKKEETAMSMVFGELDNAYAAANAAKDADAPAAVKAYEDKVASVERMAKGYVTRLSTNFSSLMPKKEMTKEELAVKERDLKRMLDILQKDVDALLAVAKTQIVLFRKDKLGKKARNEAEAFMASLDFEKRHVQMTGAIKKGAAWLAKIDRKPEADVFNAGISDKFARDLLMEVNYMVALTPTGSPHRKFLQGAAKVLQRLGALQLTGKDARFEKVISEVATCKKLLASLVKWHKSVKR